MKKKKPSIELDEKLAKVILISIDVADFESVIDKNRLEIQQLIKSIEELFPDIRK